jgi:hypothetical protein
VSGKPEVVSALEVVAWRDAGLGLVAVAEEIRADVAKRGREREGACDDVETES